MGIRPRSSKSSISPTVAAPVAAEVVIEIEASPINQYDLLLIAGGYGYRPQLPSIMGTEGIGRVVAVGARVRHVKEGDRTLVPFLHPTWAERVKTDSVDEPDELSFRTRSAGVLRRNERKANARAAAQPHF